MIDDPYKVLGVSHDASPDDIKKAYRRKAKECHPDLHPDDAKATEKMNEINEAYDMLTHPEKYQARRQQQQSTYQNPFNQYNPYGSYQQQGGQQQNGSNGYGGQNGGFYEFDFGDLFGFGPRYTYTTQNAQPVEQPSDDPNMRQAIRFINSRQYQQAINALDLVVSANRSARWYYLSAVAFHGMGSVIKALEMIQRAVQIEPNNLQYRQLLAQYRQAGQTYQSNASGFNMGAMDLQRVCTGLCVAQLLCGCLSGGGCCGGRRYYF